MKLRNPLLLLAGTVLLTACAGQREMPEGSFDYVDIEYRPSLEYPEGLQTVDRRSIFVIPEAENLSGPVGENVNIRSPRQVLTMAPGSRTDEGTTDAVLHFDAVDGVDDLPIWLWDELLAVLDERGFSIAEYEEEQYILTELNRETLFDEPRRGFLNRLRRERVEFDVEQRFLIELDVAGHRRSATVQASVTDLKWYEGGEETDVPVTLQRDMETGLLNDLSLRMERSYASDQVTTTREAAEIALGESPDGYPAYTFTSDFNTAWVLIPGMFEWLGISIEDLNQTEGVFYTEYQPDGRPGFFRRLFSSGNNIGPLELDRGTEIEFSVDEVDNIVYILVIIDGEPVNAEQLNEWLPVFQEALQEQSE